MKLFQVSSLKSKRRNEIQKSVLANRSQPIRSNPHELSAL